MEILIPILVIKTFLRTRSKMIASDHKIGSHYSVQAAGAGSKTRAGNYHRNIFVLY